ncbi:kinase-like domain-containing protein [Neohortaea acidophila]|uniref:Kinase-like domain-containing protein n=1 Tax=Neohortaea acidophila TaxID=245834 RepID=A0A6A6Q376_9PEZI|nr:kinase-like domain-containing protein [Neohortaea acidophila]KAF2486928.1 kinase-like domain-containing protein [Neohortaea acidophila]
MTVAYHNHGWPSGSPSPLCLEDKFEILKEIGDGSFGSVALGRTRTAGAHIVRRNTLVAVKTMKKTFEHFSQCMELREVIFLKTLPHHPHLVPAYDIFLDPYTKKLHIAMEHMDGNLYQLMKARDHKPLDASSVKSILYQILSGLEHIHDNGFFHRDVKPENILVSTSVSETGNAFKRYSSLITPPSTPPTYSIKIADFGLAREMHSRVPYTTYVSTRWYRAPEVLLRAGEYSAPVDIWAIGAMAVEIATLRPLFPGGNEVDQVWRVCEIMGSPSNWVNKHGQKIGGGEWREGIKLAQRLGFSFPKMAPHSLATVLPAPQWPASLVQFVTWCLMWDPKHRPTSKQALEHEYFADAVDPLMRPKTNSSNRILGRKASTMTPTNESVADSVPTLATKTSSWFRRSMPARESSAPAPPVPAHVQPILEAPKRSAIVHANTVDAAPSASRIRNPSDKRATWGHGLQSNPAPIPILPSIRPISPLRDEVTVQATTKPAEVPMESHRKIGRQLSVNSSGNHYADMHRQEAERILNGGNGLKSPTSSSGKEGFFSHLRKRARRLSGRYQGPNSPNAEDIEANAGRGTWQSSNRQAIAPAGDDRAFDSSFADLDRALRNVRHNLNAAADVKPPVRQPSLPRQPQKMASSPALHRHASLQEERSAAALPSTTSMFSRNRRSVRHPPQNKYETPSEEDELLDEAIHSAHTAARRLDDVPKVPAKHHNISQPASQSLFSGGATYSTPYLTPSTSKDMNGVSFGGSHDYAPTQPMPIPRAPAKNHQSVNPQWPTPPYDENDWAAAASASIFATQQAFR